MEKRKIPEQPEDVAQKMKVIGKRLTEYRQKVGSNYKKFSESKAINSMTLWRMEKGEDYRMSSFIQVLSKIGVSPEEFFRGIK
ncbi:MAG: hypothetical protein JXB49_30705 [Bacteroidales bacterium]|nr:hypothetical protein [Bacteroidales bacterium]